MGSFQLQIHAFYTRVIRNIDTLEIRTVQNSGQCPQVIYVTSMHWSHEWLIMNIIYIAQAVEFFVAYTVC